MLLQVDIYLHTHNKDSGDKLPAPHQTLFTSLNTASSSKILTVGRKDADVVLQGDKSVSRQHMTIELVSTEEFDEIEGKPSPRAAEGAEEVEACENASIVAVLSDSSRFGTYLISEEAQKSGGDESGTGDETDDEGQAVSQQASSQLSSISTRLLDTSAARPVKVEKNVCLNALSKPNGRAVIQCGQNGSTLVIKRVALNMALSRASKPIKQQWTSRAHLLGITFLENLEMNLTHLVTSERITNAKSLVTWCLRKPMVTFDFLEALWNRESAADPLPEPSDFSPTAGDDETFWDEKSNRKLWSHLTMLSYAPGDDMEAVCQAAGAKIVRLYDADNAIAAADEAKANEGDSCFFINSSVKKHSKIVSHVKTKLKLPYVTQKLVAQCVSQQEPLRDSHGDVIGTPVEQDHEEVEEEETPEKPVADESVEDETEDAKSPAAVEDEPEESAAKSQAAESPKDEEGAAKSQASDVSKRESQRSRKRSAPDEEEAPSSQASKRGRANEPSQNEETQMSAERMQQSEEKPAKKTSKRARDEEPSEDIIERESNQEESKPNKKKRTSFGGWTDTRKKPKAAAKKPSPEAADDDGDIPVADDDEEEEEEEVVYAQRNGLPKTDDGWLVAAPKGKARDAYKATEAELLDSLGDDAVNIPAAAETAVIDSMVVAPKSQKVRTNASSNVKDFKRFRKNTVVPRGMSRIQMRLVLPKQSDRQTELQEEEAQQEAMLREADALFQDQSNNSGSIRSHFKAKPRGRRSRNV